MKKANCKKQDLMPRVDRPKPFLKWAGSKKWLAPNINKYIPLKYNNYFEPFIGSAAIFIALDPQKGQLSDTNKNLIETYEVIQKFPHAIIRELSSMIYNKKFIMKLETPLKKWGK